VWITCHSSKKGSHFSLKWHSVQCRVWGIMIIFMAFLPQHFAPWLGKNID
jgi:hypothetical protein